MGIARVLNEVVRMGLVARVDDRYRSRKEVIRAFLPARAREDARPPAE